MASKVVIPKKNGKVYRTCFKCRADKDPRAFRGSRTICRVCTPYATEDELRRAPTLADTYYKKERAELLEYEALHGQGY